MRPWPTGWGWGEGCRAKRKEENENYCGLIMDKVTILKFSLILALLSQKIERITGSFLDIQCVLYFPLIFRSSRLLAPTNTFELHAEEHACSLRVVSIDVRYGNKVEMSFSALWEVFCIFNVSFTFHSTSVRTFC